MASILAKARHPEVAAAILAVVHDALSVAPSPLAAPLKSRLSPSPDRRAFLARAAARSKATVDAEPAVKAALAIIRRKSAIAKHVKLPPQAEPVYELYYDALWCRLETTYDRGSTQDEPYVIVTVTPFDDSGHGGETVTTRNPNLAGDPDKQVYRDVDDKNMRRGPRVLCWRGRAPSRLLITTSVFEHDDGEPEMVREGLDVVIEAAVAIAIVFGQDWAGKIKDAVKDVLHEALKWFGLEDDDGDDLISMEFVDYATRADLIAAANAPRMHWSWQSASQNYNVKTDHHGKGAIYYTFLTWGSTPP